MNTQKVNELCDLIKKHKKLEDSHKKRRVDAESELIGMISTKPEGVDKTATERFVVTVTNKMSRTLDYPAYLAVEQTLPEGLRFVTLKPEIDLKKLRALELANAQIPAQFITTKPAKASVKIEDARDGN